MTELDQYLTRDEAAKVMRTTKQALANMAHRHQGPPFIIVGRQALYPKRELAAWLSARNRLGDGEQDGGQR